LHFELEGHDGVLLFMLCDGGNRVLDELSGEICVLEQGHHAKGGTGWVHLVDEAGAVVVSGVKEDKDMPVLKI
jgi:hypothetical protein